MKIKELDIVHKALLDPQKPPDELTQVTPDGSLVQVRHWPDVLPAIEILAPMTSWVNVPDGLSIYLDEEIHPKGQALVIPQGAGIQYQRDINWFVDDIRRPFSAICTAHNYEPVQGARIMCSLAASDTDDAFQAFSEMREILRLAGGPVPIASVSQGSIDFAFNVSIDVNTLLIVAVSGYLYLKAKGVEMKRLIGIGKRLDKNRDEEDITDAVRTELIREFLEENDALDRLNDTEGFGGEQESLGRVDVVIKRMLSQEPSVQWKGQLGETSLRDIIGQWRTQSAVLPPQKALPPSDNDDANEGAET